MLNTYYVVSRQEFPFFTLTSFPAGFLVHAGGVVSARSVKLLDRIHNPGEFMHTNTEHLLFSFCLATKVSNIFNAACHPPLLCYVIFLCLNIDNIFPFFFNGLHAENLW